MNRARLTVACPEADRDDANQLAVCLGWSEGWTPDEWQETFTAKYQDAQGNMYRVMSCEVGVSFVEAATTMGEVQRPAADVEPYVVNLTGARRAQDKLVTWQPGDGDAPQAAPDRIVAIVGPSGREALRLMGLTALQPE